MRLKDLSAPTPPPGGWPKLKVVQPKQDHTRKGNSKRGRRVGALGKKTLEKIAAAERELAGYKRTKRLSVDYMDEMIEFFHGLIAGLAPWASDENKKLHQIRGDTAIWFKCVELFQGFLHMRAPYQSPRLSAVALMPAQSAKRTTVNVTILNERGERLYGDPLPEEEQKLIEGEVG